MILFQDLRHGFRALLRQPFFTLVSVVVLGLGIGANTAVYSVINAVLLRPLAYPEPDRLALLRERTPEFPRSSVALPNYLDWRAAQKGFTDLAIVRRANFSLSYPKGIGAAPERLRGAEVSANYLKVLGLHPILGRDLAASDDIPGAPKVAALGEALWRRRFGADPKIIGLTVNINDVPREIVGVLPAAVNYPSLTEAIVPLGDLRKDPINLDRDSHPGFSVLGRLKPGTTLALATDDLEGICGVLEKQYPDSNTGHLIDARPLLEASVGEYRRSLYLLLGAVGCVLLIACANVANLQLARATGRRKELAVRAALGASRLRLLRLSLTESALLGVLGGAVGILLALWAMDAIMSLSPRSVPRFHEAHLDWHALAFAAAVAVGSGLLVGIWPAWRMARTAAMATALHEANTRGGAGSASQSRTRSWLVVVQFALAVVLLAGAGLTIKSFYRTFNEPFGFRRDGVLAMSVTLPETRYRNEKIDRFFEGLLGRLRALPGVESAATGVNLPFDENDWDSGVHVIGTPPDLPGKQPSAEINLVSPDYFNVMGIPLVRGRVFDSRDGRGQPKVTVIDESLARKFFPGQDPIGKQVDDNQTEEKDVPPVTIIGVVGRTRNEPPGPLPEVEAQMHFSSAQYDAPNRTVVVRVRSGDPLALAEPVRQALLAMDPDLPAGEVTTIEGNVAASFSSQRLTLMLLGVFAGLALILASLGLYGVMALGVAQRTRELGIRLALGAQRASVLRLVLGQSARLVGFGLALGLAAALAAGRLVSSAVYGVSTADAEILLLVALLLGAVGLLASYLPARRATRIDPLTALREE